LNMLAGLLLKESTTNCFISEDIFFRKLIFILSLEYCWISSKIGGLQEVPVAGVDSWRVVVFVLPFCHAFQKD